MSIKIYNAFRVKDRKPQNLWPLLWKIQDQAEANIRLAFREHYLQTVRQMDPDSAEYQEAKVKSTLKDELLFRTLRAREITRTGFKKNSTEMLRDTYSLDVAVTIYPYRGRTYLRTFSESISVVGQCLNFVREMPELEDFHYQNQADPPKEVPLKEWAQRRRVWDGITKYQDVGRFVTLEILSFSNFWKFDPFYDLVKEWRDSPPKLPTREEVWAEELLKLPSLKGVKLQVRKGLIRAPKRFTISKEALGWSVTYQGQTLPYPTLNQAADYVHFEYLPTNTKDLVRHLIANAKEQEHVGKK